MTLFKSGDPTEQVFFFTSWRKESQFPK